MVFVQQCGRASRMYGHKGLDRDEQTITIQIYTAALPHWIQGDPLSMWCYRTYARKNTCGKDVERRAQNLRARLQEVGVNSLRELKLKLESFAIGVTRRAEEGGQKGKSKS